MSSRITVRQLRDALDQMIKEHPYSKDMPIITSIDEEGNGYNWVWEPPALVQIHDVEDLSNIEYVAMYDPKHPEGCEERESAHLDDCNAVLV